MINHYTANKKVRNDDAYSPGGRIGLRPDRATIPYCQRAREAFTGVPIIAGGVEASLRRLAHYDYWSDTVRRAIMLDAKADLVVFGMGEHQIVTIANRLAAGETVKDLRDMRGSGLRTRCQRVAVASSRRDRAALVRGGQGRQAEVRPGDQDHPPGDEPLQCPAAGPISRPPGDRLQPAAVADQPRRHGPDLRLAVYAQAAPDVQGGKKFRPSRSSRTR